MYGLSISYIILAMAIKGHTGLEALLQTERTCYIHGSEEAIEKAERLIRLAMTGEDIVASWCNVCS